MKEETKKKHNTSNDNICIEAEQRAVAFAKGESEKRQMATAIAALIRRNRRNEKKNYNQLLVCVLCVSQLAQS